MDHICHTVYISRNESFFVSTSLGLYQCHETQFWELSFITLLFWQKWRICGCFIKCRYCLLVFQHADTKTSAKQADCTQREVAGHSTPQNKLCVCPYLSVCLSVYLSIYLSVWLSTYLPTPIYLCIYLCRSIQSSIHKSINCLSVCLSVCLPACLPASLHVSYLQMPYQ